MERWSRFWRLQSVERRMVLEAAAALAATKAGLRIVGLRRWNSAIERLTSVKTQAAKPDGALRMNGLSAVLASDVAMKLDLAARNLFFRTNCLERSLALTWLLRRRGIAADLRIGARKEADVFEAHAWLELNGLVLNDPDEAHRHFAPFEAESALLETQTR